MYAMCAFHCCFSQLHIKQIKTACKPLPQRLEKKEDLSMRVFPEHSEECSLVDGCMILRKLDLRNIAVISSVMAQTVAMDRYSADVDMVRHKHVPACTLALTCAV